MGGGGSQNQKIPPWTAKPIAFLPSGRLTYAIDAGAKLQIITLTFEVRREDNDEAFVPSNIGGSKSG